MSPKFLLVICAYDIAGLVFGALLLRGVGKRVTWWREVGALILVGSVLAMAALMFGVFAFHGLGFAVIRLLAHALFCVLAPLMLFRGAWHLWRGARGLGGVLLLAGLSMEGIWYWSLEVEPYRLEVTQYDYESERLSELSGSIRVAVLADLQTDEIGDYERRVFRTMDGLRADLILLPGDYIQEANEVKRERARRDLVELFNGLAHEPRYGIWGVDGDVDSAAKVFRGSVARPIRDETVVLTGTPSLQLIGLSRPASRQPLTKAQRKSIVDFPGLTIVMGHAPDFVYPAIENPTGDSTNSLPILGVAGHTHGGQVVVPGYGPPVTLSRLPRRYASGMHTIGKLTFLVSRGVGMERGYAPRVRFNCRPELAIITLRSSK